MTDRSHQPSRSRTHRSWEAMRQRVLNPKCSFYKHYGGRGIRICARWSKFAAFLEDMGECPPGLFLERKENDGDYEPDNCIWTTRTAQNRNRRYTKLSEAIVLQLRRESAAGASQNVLARKFAISQSHVWRVIHRESWI